MPSTRRKRGWFGAGAAAGVGVFGSIGTLQRTLTKIREVTRPHEKMSQFSACPFTVTHLDFCYEHSCLEARDNPLEQAGSPGDFRVSCSPEA
jgi:hypothetical protein